MRMYPLSPRVIALVLSAWLLLTANWALWRQLASVAVTPWAQPVLWLGILLLVGLATVAFMALLAWPRGMKPLWVAVLVLAAVAQHYMLTYGVVVDATMVANVLATDTREAADLLSPRLLAQVAVVAGLPALWLWKQPVQAGIGAWRQLARTGGVFALSLLLLLGGSLALYRQLAPLVRSHMELRYTVNPLASVLSTASVTLKPLLRRDRRFVPVTAGATAGPSYAQGGKPPLLVLVVGETARADHFSLNGYARETNAALARESGVLSWRQVRSCGTNTLASVPCMFSPLGKAGYEKRDAEYGNLLDVIQAAGLAVLWVDNQSGCKGVCNRVASASTADIARRPEAAALCRDGECLDDALLVGLDERIAALPAERRARGVVVVLHQMGSHGPAYFKRSDARSKRFMPECRNTVLSECPPQEVVNGYDNSIAHTDLFLAQTIAWLRARQDRHATGLLYVSDHGESLGEFGLYLHGVPYPFAPDVQKHVPMIAWLDGGLAGRTGLQARCLADQLDRPLTHDHYFHTVLGLIDVRSPLYRRELDAWSGCRPVAVRPEGENGPQPTQNLAMSLSNQ